MINDKSRKTIKGFQVSLEEFLKAKPVRHPDLKWEEDEKGLHVKIPRKQTLLFRFLSRFLPISRERRVLLDEQGALVLSLCDGEHQIKEIAKKLCERYNMRVSDAEAALDLYFVQLSKSGLVGFVLPDSARKRYHRRLGRKKRQLRKVKDEWFIALLCALLTAGTFMSKPRMVKIVNYISGKNETLVW